MEYVDPIISHFKDQENISKETLAELIKEQQGKESRAKKNVGPSHKLHIRDKNLSNCEKALSIFTDLLKLTFLIQKSWDLQALCKSVLVRFDIQTSGYSGQEPKLDHAETFYRELALKTITRCGKLSEAIEKLSLDSQAIRDYLQEQSEYDAASCISDSACLLLEMWFLCGKTMQSLKRNVAALFIKAKLLLIDCELEVMKSLASEDGYGSLEETVTSYRLFIKVLLQQIQDADTNHDQTLFEECLQVFLDVESMFNAMNINCLLYETQHAPQESQITQSAKSNIVQEASELRDISQFVDDTVNAEVHSDENEFADLLPKELGTIKERRMSETSSLSVSLMMEKTSLKRELPNLLQAFNNAKRLEQELENARATKSSPQENSLLNLSMRAPTSSLSSSMISPSSSVLMSSLPRFGSELSSSMYSKSSSMGLEDDSKVKEDSLMKSTNSASDLRLIPPDPHPASGKNDKLLRLSSIQKLPSSYRQTTNVQGFGSNVLNNLYGLGNKN
ncbi:LANO_0G10814g1_1 [Lachancea nothofagi CBS 11611]|uniref:LANO_0G10814g1_1 n=1 Tax=Lachancea nothofagi CBS 11611 TaxID=1266666 RepID=A0A1G4KJD0_9SACH|nr:LANO_0G10814g1_1 [Lachancea nothofagi CBS 11611]